MWAIGAAEFSWKESVFVSGVGSRVAGFIGRRRWAEGPVGLERVDSDLGVGVVRDGFDWVVELG